MSVIVRPATADDLDDYVKMAAVFHAASPISGAAAFDASTFRNFYMSALENPNIGLWAAFKDDQLIGIAGALLYPLYFNTNAIAVQELWWWLTPEARGTGAGKQMYDAIEAWAQENDANVLFMIALEDSNAKKMENIYARAGLRPMERTFFKEVSSWQ